MKRLIWLPATATVAIILSSCGGTSGSSNQGPSPDPTSICQNNACDFSYALRGGNNALLGIPTGLNWGPQAQPVAWDQSLSGNLGTNSWQQNRILAAINYWVNQKVNYCHHHVPTWWPNPEDTAFFQDGICSNSSNLYPITPLTGQAGMIRWNYSGQGTESQNAWYQADGAYGNYVAGLDCSDFSALVYNFGLSQLFTSNVSLQAGQQANQAELAPNMPGFQDNVSPDIVGLPSAGQLVCADGSLAATSGTSTDATACNGHGGYISVYNSSGTYESQAITDAMLNNLQPGDLVYIAGSAASTRTVTHVVIWTGQKIGASSWITESQIAPQADADLVNSNPQLCVKQGAAATWRAENNLGTWIIADSHYQGPDFRAFTPCFYRTQVWGVRRVIGANQNLRPQYISTPITTQNLTYTDANSNTKSMLTVNVGGGINASVVADTGSSYLVIQQQYVGPNAINTGVEKTIEYVSGLNVTGTIYLAPVTYNRNNYLSTNYAPIVVVANTTDFGTDVAGIMGLKMNNQVSTKNYLPNPQNQAMVINRPANASSIFDASSLTFGNLTANQSSFQTYQLETESCASVNLGNFESYLATNTCYNDQAIPVTYSVTNDDVTEEIEIPTIFDSGSVHTDLTLTTCSDFSISNTASLAWANNYSVLTTLPGNCFEGSVPTANLGINVFSNNLMLYNQATGTFGILSNP